MTAISARSQYIERATSSAERGKPSHICLPAALDAMLPISELPDEYYDRFNEGYFNPNPTYNTNMGYLLRKFFYVEPMPDTDLASVAKFNAFGASPQAYMPDAPYEFPDMGKYFEEGGVTQHQMRLIALLGIARENGCNILFTNNAGHVGEHVSGLQMIDRGNNPLQALYIVRDFTEIQGQSMYFPIELAGIPQTIEGDAVTDFTPLPTVQRPYFPGQSWELIILPPDPGL